MILILISLIYARCLYKLLSRENKVENLFLISLNIKRNSFVLLSAKKFAKIITNIRKLISALIVN